jgi:hypothetical protein
MTIKSSKQPVVATDLRFSGRSERAIGNNGEVNASSKKDLLANAMQLMTAAADGGVITASQAEEAAEISARNRVLIQAAFDDPTAHRILGEKMANEVYMTANRKGYMRRFLNRIDLRQGDIARFPVRRKNASAITVTGPTKVETQVLTDKWFTPPEFQVVSRIFVPQNEINQSNTDVLEEKHVEALEGVMVTEDRMYTNLLRNAIGVDNNLSLISGTMSPSTLMAVRQNVVQWGMKAMYCLMASDLFVDIVGDASFIQAIEPVAKHELIMTGELGVLYGMTLVSESYRHPEHKVMNAGEFFVLSDPAFHGAYADRGGVDSQPIDGTTEKMIGRGWLLSESLAMSVCNTRTVAAGKRV